MRPSIGRIVHWVDGSGVHRPAIIEAVRDFREVDLIVFSEPYNIRVTSVFDDFGISNCGFWHYPERE